MSADLKTQKDPRWGRVALFVAVVLFVAATTWNLTTRISIQRKTTSSIEQIVDAIETVCVENTALTRQYKIRGEDEVILTHSVLLTTEAFIDAIVNSPAPASASQRRIRAAFLHRYEATIPKLRHILATIHILPPPDCKLQGKRLRVKLPPG